MFFNVNAERLQGGVCFPLQFIVLVLADAGLASDAVRQVHNVLDRLLSIHAFCSSPVYGFVPKRCAVLEAERGQRLGQRVVPESLGKFLE